MSIRHHDPKDDMLREVPAFADLKRKRLQEVSRLLDVIDVREGRELIHEGERSGEFFVVVHGTAVVEKDGRQVAEVGDGDVIGEMGLLEHRRRNATVRATSPLRVLVGTPQAFDAVRDLVPGWAEAVDAEAARRAQDA